MQTIVTISAIFLYAASFFLLLKHIISKEVGSTNTFKTFFFFSIALHIASLNYSIFPNQNLQLGFLQVSSLIFCVISIIALISIMRKLPIENLLIALFPFTILSLFIGEWIAKPTATIIFDNGLICHIILSILAYSIITIASLQAIALAAQETLLKRHEFKGIFEYLPPLQTMEKLLFEMITIGFVLLTLSIASGFIFLENMFAQHLAHKTLLSLMAWIVFAILLYGRHAQGWRGRTATKLTMLGFVFLMLAYFGSKFVLEIVLHRV